MRKKVTANKEKERESQRRTKPEEDDARGGGRSQRKEGGARGKKEESDIEGEDKQTNDAKMKNKIQTFQRRLLQTTTARISIHPPIFPPFLFL